MRAFGASVTLAIITVSPHAHARHAVAVPIQPADGHSRSDDDRRQRSYPSARSSTYFHGWDWVEGTRPLVDGTSGTGAATICACVAAGSSTGSAASPNSPRRCDPSSPRSLRVTGQTPSPRVSFSISLRPSETSRGSLMWQPAMCTWFRLLLACCWGLPVQLPLAQFIGPSSPPLVTAMTTTYPAIK